MLNRVILMGRLVADPELRQTPSNIAVCKFKIAIDRPYSQGGEKKADFISVTAWRQSAEFVNKYFTKGKMIIVEGSIQNNDYTDKDGVKHYSMGVQADKVSFGESKGNQVDKPQSEPASDVDLNGFEEILNDGSVPF